MSSCGLHGSCSTWPHLPVKLLHPARLDGTSVPQELFSKTPKRILRIFNVLGCIRRFLRLLFARPCQHTAKLLGSGFEGRKQNSFSISSVLTSKEAMKSVSADGDISHAFSFLSPVFSEIRWDCCMLNVDILTARSVYIKNNNSAIFHQEKKKKIIIKIGSKNDLHILQYHKNVVVYYARFVRLQSFLYVLDLRFLYTACGKFTARTNVHCFKLRQLYRKAHFIYMYTF